MFDELKTVYVAYYNNSANDEKAQKMDGSLRNVKYEDIIKPLTLKSMNPMKKELGPIGKDWIEYIKEYEKGYFKQLTRKGLLVKQAVKEQEKYYKKVEEIKALAKDNPYPPGGAEEVAKMFLFPELYP